MMFFKDRHTDTIRHRSRQEDHDVLDTTKSDFDI